MDSNLYEIVYDQDLVQANNNLTGYFDILHRETIITSVKLQLWSKSKCSWIQGKTFLRSKDKKYSGNSESLYAEAILSNFEIVNRKRRYNFKLKVPPDIPASWQGKCGYILYENYIKTFRTKIKNNYHIINVLLMLFLHHHSPSVTQIICMVKIIVDQTKNVKKIFESEIAVLPYRDLKLEPHLLHESRQDVNHSFHFTLLSLGFVEMSIWFPICGIAAGQTLPLLCTIKNQSNTLFNTIMFILNQNEIYRSTKPINVTKVQTYEVIVLKRHSDLTFGCYEYYCIIDTDKKMYPTSQFSANTCCRVTYDIKVRIISNSSDSHEKIIVETPEMPIVIGTEPILEWSIKELTAEITKETYNLKTTTSEESEENESEILSEDILEPVFK